MKKNKISFYFIFISLLTFLTVFFSIVQKSYFSFITPQQSVENDALLSNFNPNLDLTILSIIESKNKNTDESFDFSTIKSNQPKEVTITPTPIPTSVTTESTDVITDMANEIDSSDQSLEEETF